jgi:hypothetical protein
VRLLQLATGPGELLDLHPNVTVVQGLDGDHRHRLIDAVAGLARGSGVAGGGLLEAHGVLFEPRAELLGLLDLAELDLDPIVRPGDLPAQPMTVDARELRTREEEFAGLLSRISAQAERVSIARDAVAAATTAVERARRAHADAAADAARRLAEGDELTSRVDHLTEDKRRIERERTEVEAALVIARAALAEVEARTAEVREAAARTAEAQATLEAERDRVAADRDAAAADAVERAQAELAEVLAATTAGPPAEDVDGPRARAEQVAARIEALDRMIAALAPRGPDEVAAALALLRGTDSTEQVPSEEAVAVAEQLEAVARELGPDEDGATVEGSLTEARTRLNDAQQALLEAEQAARGPELARDAVRELEDAHDALQEAIGKAEGRFARASARARVTELRATEQAILDRLGFPSYAAYVMGSPTPVHDPEKQAAVHAARAELAAAEVEWRRLGAATDVALERAALLDHRRALLERARALLGGVSLPVEAIPDALRALRVPVVSVARSARRLQLALDAAGVDLGDEHLDEAELAVIADAWLVEAAAADRRRQAALDERASLEAEWLSLSAEAVPALDAWNASAPALDQAGEQAEREAAARAGLAEAENHWLASELAEERWPELVGELEGATAAATEAAEAAAGGLAEVAAARAAIEGILERERALEEEREVVRAVDAALRAELEALPTIAPDPAELDAEIETSESRFRDAATELEAEIRALDALDADGQAVAIEIERLQDIVSAQHSGGATEADELEWYLLARLAAQRSVSIAGSLPLLLDDALRGLDAKDVDHLLGRLERIAEAVQVIIISDDPLVADWARAAGSARAAVVRPSAA